MMAPVLPAALWALAAAFLVLLMLVIFGYHLYQRSRMAAFLAESGSLGKLAAQKERLEADAVALREWLTSQQAEVQKYESERHKQELLRVDLAQLERNLELRKKEDDKSLKYAADLDVLIVKKRNLLSRLTAEVKTLEERKAELEPLNRSAQELRAELEQGKIKTALLAEQELKTANLQQLAYSLGREAEELQRSLEPLRQEKNRLRLFIEQARHASSVKNERILEQNEQIRNLELARNELQKQLELLTSQIENDATKANEAANLLANARQEQTETEAALQAREQELRAEIDALARDAQKKQEALASLALRLDEQQGELARLEARRARIELAMEPLQKQKSGPARQRRSRQATVRPNKAAARMSPRPKSQQVFCK